MKYLFGLLLIGLCTISVAQPRDKVVPFGPDLSGDLMIDIGLNRWSSMPKGTSREAWPSKSIGIYYSKRKAFGRKLSLYYGLGLGLEKVGLGDSATLVSRDSASVEGLPFDQSAVNKNKLAITYLDIPLEVRFHPKGTQDGEGLFLSVGGIIGLRLNSHTKWKYEEADQNKRQKISGNFDLNSFRYGYQARLGFRGIHFFYKQYLSDVFDNKVGGARPQMRTIGINLTGF